MADVTISQLNRGIPFGNNILPYSTGSTTLGVAVSSIFQSVSCVGIGGPAKTGINVGSVGTFNDPDIALAVKNPYNGLSFYPNATFYTDISANKRNFIHLFAGRSGWSSGNEISLIYGTLTASPGVPFGPGVGYSSSSFTIGAWGGQSGLHLTSEGKVGVGVVTPQATLDVNGSIKGNIANFTDSPVQFFSVINNSAYPAGGITSQHRVGTLTLSKKSLCIFTWSTTGYQTSTLFSNGGSSLTATLSIDSIGYLQSISWHSNEPHSHKSSPCNQTSTILGAGTYTVRITLGNGTNSDQNDYANCNVIAIASE